MQKLITLILLCCLITPVAALPDPIEIIPFNCKGVDATDLTNALIDYCNAKPCHSGHLGLLSELEREKNRESIHSYISLSNHTDFTLHNITIANNSLDFNFRASDAFIYWIKQPFLFIFRPYILTGHLHADNWNPPEDKYLKRPWEFVGNDACTTETHLFDIGDIKVKSKIYRCESFVAQGENWILNVENEQCCHFKIPHPPNIPDNPFFHHTMENFPFSILYV